MSSGTQIIGSNPEYTCFARSALCSRVAEDVRRHERPLQKSLDLDENLKHLHALFCPIIKICRDLRTFWKTWCNKVPFGDNNSVSWARSESLYGVCCILH